MNISSMDVGGRRRIYIVISFINIYKLNEIDNILR